MGYLLAECADCSKEGHHGREGMSTTLDRGLLPGASGSIRAHQRSVIELCAIIQDGLDTFENHRRNILAIKVGNPMAFVRAVDPRVGQASARSDACGENAVAG